MIVSLIPLVISAALSIPITLPRTAGMIPKPLYRKPIKASRASYVQTMNSNASYHAMFEVSSDIPVFHLMNLPGIQSVRCYDHTVTVETENPNIMEDWSDLQQIMLIMDFYECPMQNDPFHVTDSWTIDGNKIKFQIKTALDEDIDASVNVLIHPVKKSNHVKFNIY